MKKAIIIRYNSLKKLILLPIAVMFMMPEGCAPKNIADNSRPFFFFQMADPQFGMFANDSDFTKETINFSKAIKSANRLHPAFVVVCGDLVNQFVRHDEIAEYKRIAAKLDPSIPLYNVAGNHDVGSPQPTVKGLANYRNNFGKDYYTFRYRDLYGIVINSSLFYDPTLVPEEAERQDKWLRSTLKKAKKMKHVTILVFQHIPWFLHQPNEKDGYFKIPLERRMIYLDLFKKYGVKYIFAGHLHQNAIGWYKNIEMITSGPVGKPLGSDPSGFRIVRVYKSKISHKYYSLDSIPGHIDL